MYNNGMKVEKELQMKRQSMSDIAMDIDDLVEQGMSAKYISVVLGVPYEWAEYAIQNRADEELQKQYEFMQYAEDAANADAEFYGAQ
jgi:queuine/archaeosine tRNA-ribosyltransferase